jgi:hypothetical protein
MLLASPPAADTAPQERMLPIRRANPWPRALAVAATLVLAVGIGVFAYLGQPSVPKATFKAPPATESAPGPDVGLAYGPAKPPSAGLAREDDKERRLAEDRDDTDRVAELKRDAARPEAPRTDLAKQLAKKAEPRFGNGFVAPAEKPAAPSPGPAAQPAALPPGEPAATAPAVVVNGAGQAPGKAGFSLETPLAPRQAEDRESERQDAAANATGVLAQVEDFQIQSLVNSVAEGTAPLEKLKAVATRDNLKRVENQLVIEAGSLERANTALVQLFDANGLAPLVEAEVAAAAPGTKPPVAVKGKLAGPERGRASLESVIRAPSPAGFYYPVHYNGEDAWIVVTDRDNLSRFGSQLAAAGDLTVSRMSSEPLRDIRKLQDQLRRSGAAGGALKAAASLEEGVAREEGGKGAVDGPAHAAKASQAAGERDLALKGAKTPAKAPAGQTSGQPATAAGEDESLALGKPAPGAPGAPQEKVAGQPPVRMVPEQPAPASRPPPAAERPGKEYGRGEGRKWASGAPEAKPRSEGKAKPPAGEAERPDDAKTAAESWGYARGTTPSRHDTAGAKDKVAHGLGTAGRPHDANGDEYGLKHDNAFKTGEAGAPAGAVAGRTVGAEPKGGGRGPAQQATGGLSTKEGDAPGGPAPKPAQEMMEESVQKRARAQVFNVPLQNQVILVIRVHRAAQAEASPKAAEAARQAETAPAKE